MTEQEIKDSLIDYNINEKHMAFKYIAIATSILIMLVSSMSLIGLGMIESRITAIAISIFPSLSVGLLIDYLYFQVHAKKVYGKIIENKDDSSGNTIVYKINSKIYEAMSGYKSKTSEKANDEIMLRIDTNDYRNYRKDIKKEIFISIYGFVLSVILYYFIINAQ